MGYRFDLETVNIIANLAFGRVSACYRALIESPDQVYGFLYFFENFERNFYSGDKSLIVKKINTLYKEFEEIYWQGSNLSKDYDYDFDRYFMSSSNDRILKIIRDLSLIVGRCQIKSLLLPQVFSHSRSFVDNYMTSEETLKTIIRWHPKESCLVLQPQQRPDEDGVVVFDSFPNFEIALRQIDSWPAVLFWDERNDFVFMPIDDKYELEMLYKLIHFDRGNPLGELKRRASHKSKKSSQYYLHLSDLHFGANNVLAAERRLKSLINNCVSNIEDSNKVGFILTGDVLDSPTKANRTSYSSFAEYIESISNLGAVFVLGNHDVNSHGLAFTSNNQAFADVISGYPKIQINEEVKTIFLLFNSNVKGQFAEGEIGKAQLFEMGNLIDAIKGLEKYRLIAVLHHHVMPIPKPTWFTKRWFERFIPKDIMESTLKLRDAQQFLDWLKIRNVRIVLHGHKHIPFIHKEDNISIVACGSSTGQVNHIDKNKTYMSYNLLKIDKDSVTCTQYVEETPGGGAKDIFTVIL
jgi:calcineurin-like phosphoesterase family protein